MRMREVLPDWAALVVEGCSLIEGMSVWADAADPDWSVEEPPVSVVGELFFLSSPSVSDFTVGADNGWLAELDTCCVGSG